MKKYMTTTSGGNNRKQHYLVVISRYTSFLNEIIGKTDTKKEGEGGGGD